MLSERSEWLRDVAMYTEPHRFDRSVEHAHRALKALTECDCVAVLGDDGKTFSYERVDPKTGEVENTSRKWGRDGVICKHRSTAFWHDYRSLGQRQRFEQVEDCGNERIALLCRECGHKHKEQPKHCGHHRVCLGCRGRRAARIRNRFRRARKAALYDHRKAMQGHASYASRGRRWKEAFMTLTYPDSGEPSDDVKAIYSAWPRFIRRVRLHLFNRGTPEQIAKTLPFLRVLEIAGKQGGHAHIHVWMLAPFIHYSVLRSLWARSLDEDAQARLFRVEAVRLTADLLGCSIEHALAEERAGTIGRERRDILDAARERHDGKPLPCIMWPVLDVRKVTGDPANELIKYLVKDLSKDGLIDSLAFSRVFVALEGRRVTITSRYLWLMTEPSECPKCNAKGAVVAEKIDASEASTDSCRAPPAKAA
jgi:hypothetical protein